MSYNNYKQTQLSNGLTIVSESVDTVYSVALGFCILAGSNDETSQTNGIAHLIEHMGFKGTKKRSAFEIANEIESIGGKINAFTKRNYTCFYTRLMSEHLGKGVEVISDIIKNSAIDPDELEKEKTVIHEEIKDREDKPRAAIHDYFIEQLFPDHPYGRPIQGTLDSVKNIDREEILDFINNYYRSKNIVVAASGRIEHEKLVQEVRKYFEVESKEQVNKKEKDLTKINNYQEIHRRDIQQAHIILGRRIFPRKDKRRFQLSLINMILSGGLTSRLFQNIREKYGFVYSSYSFFELYKNTGIFGIYVGTDKNRIDETRELLKTELRKIAEGNITKEELNQKKQQYKGSAMLSLESMSGRMRRLAKMAIMDKELLTIDGLLEKISSIKIDDIVNLADYILDETQIIETVIRPN